MRPSPDDVCGAQRGSRTAAAVLAGGAGILGILAALGRSGHEIAWPFATAERKALDRDFIRNMTAHHQVGVRLSLLAAEKATTTRCECSDS